MLLPSAANMFAVNADGVMFAKLVGIESQLTFVCAYRQVPGSPSVTLRYVFLVFSTEPCAGLLIVIVGALVS